MPLSFMQDCCRGHDGLMELWLDGDGLQFSSAVCSYSTFWPSRVCFYQSLRFLASMYTIVWGYWVLEVIFNMMHSYQLAHMMSLHFKFFSFLHIWHLLLFPYLLFKLVFLPTLINWNRFAQHPTFLFLVYDVLQLREAALENFDDSHLDLC
jgi:hypothetical protein